MNSSNVDLSDVSLIIATYNEEESLGFVLNELETIPKQLNDLYLNFSCLFIEKILKDE